MLVRKAHDDPPYAWDLTPPTGFRLAHHHS
jgi:hypothetical protein